MNICELLDCDIDYFLTEQDDFQKEVRSASEYLGLSYNTVERISDYDDKIKGLLDVIVFDNHNNSSNEDMKNADLLFDFNAYPVRDSIFYKDMKQYKKDYRQLLIVFSSLYTILHITNCNPCKVRVKSLYNLHLTFKKCFIYAVFKPFYLSRLFIVGK